MVKEQIPICLINMGGDISKIPLEIAVTLLSRDYKGVNNYGFNGVIEIMGEVRVLGQMDNTLDGTFESANRVYDSEGVCPTIPTCSGGGGFNRRFWKLKK